VFAAGIVLTARIEHARAALGVRARRTARVDLGGIGFRDIGPGVDRARRRAITLIAAAEGREREEHEERGEQTRRRALLHARILTGFFVARKGVRAFS
jgi:hypothetical protein